MRTQQQINKIAESRRAVLQGCSDNVFDEILGEIDFRFEPDTETEWCKFLSACNNVRQHGAASQ